MKKAPSLTPAGSFAGKVPTIDWAVMQDPFWNEFCLVSDLAPGEIKAVLDPP